MNSHYCHIILLEIWIYKTTKVYFVMLGSGYDLNETQLSWSKRGTIKKFASHAYLELAQLTGFVTS